MNSECDIAPFKDFSNTKYPRIIEEFQEKVAYAGKYEYCDNFRVSNVSVLDEIIYHVQYTNGCCGGHDEDFIYEGITYKVGFNYGH